MVERHKAIDILREIVIEMVLKISADLVERFPGLRVLVARVDGIKVEKEKVELQQFKEEIIEEIKQTYNLATVKDVPIFRAYRDFFWRIGIDPTKVRPAAEALIRRVLAGKPIPTINTLVDAYNLASIKTGIAMGAFDADKLRGDLELRFAREGEKFVGIGMDEPIKLNGNEIVGVDAEKLIAIYPYRDADETKVTEATKNVVLLICGAPGIEEEILRRAAQVAIEYITRFCGGEGRSET